MEYSKIFVNTKKFFVLFSSAFRIGDESSTNREYFYCSTRDEMAKWMNKMGLAAINFNIDDSKIAGFNKGFVDSVEGSPVTTPIIGGNSTPSGKHQRIMHVSSQGDSENESDKDSSVSWQIFASHHSSSSETGTSKDKVKSFIEAIQKRIHSFSCIGFT